MAATSQQNDSPKEGEGLGTTVAQHYNNLEEIGIDKRKESRIFYMRGFNNWVKSMLINEFVTKVRESCPREPIAVLDLGSGKGGDQKKWQTAKVNSVVHADIAETSVKQSEERYQLLKSKGNPHSKYPPFVFDAEFIAADCSKERLRERYKSANIGLSLTSCQFVFHYSFETLEQADMMMRNACENLKPGGYFFGTTPDARELVRRLKESDDLSFGNDVYRVTFSSKTDFPLFGCKYDFHLEGVVDCPEFLIHMPLLQKLGEKYGMMLVYMENFASLVENKIKERRNFELLHRMTALEEYPPPANKQLVSPNPKSYLQAETKLKDLKESGVKNPRLLTISKEEWEAITLYLAFAFRKRSSPSTNNPEQSEQSQTNLKRKLPPETESTPPAKQAPPTLVT